MFLFLKFLNRSFTFRIDQVRKKGSNHSKDKLIFATKDQNITQYASTQPGVPLVYLNGNTILLDRPSESTTKEISNNAQSKLGLTEHEQQVLSEIREEKRLKEAPKAKRKKPQNPNPLR